MSLAEKNAQFATDVDIAHQIIHGPSGGAGSTVTTASGPVRTLAKLIADKDAEINDAATGIVAEAIDQAVEAAGIAVANDLLMTWAYNQSFQLVSGTRDTNGALTSATIKWPDGTNGVFTADTLSTNFPGAIDAWHATHLGAATKTVTQPLVTRDANGAVTAQPAITIS